MSIRDELEGNRAGVAEALDYHLHHLDTLGTVMRTGGPDPDHRTFRRGFTSPATVVTTAWDVAQATDVLGHMPCRSPSFWIPEGVVESSHEEVGPENHFLLFGLTGINPYRPVMLKAA